MMATAAPQGLLRKLEWRVRHVADTNLGGEYRSAFRGRGREFDQVVRYEWGDDVRDIDWNVTARLGEPYRKKFVEERELTVVLLFEDSLSLQFGSGSKTKRDTLLEVGGLLALLSASNRDRAGFWHATPDRDLVRRPVRGRGTIVKAAANLLSQPVPQVDAGGQVEIDWKRFMHAFPRHSVVLWLGDFAPRVEPDCWSALRSRYQMIGVRVDDPWERELPRGKVIAAVDPVAGQLVPFDTNSRANRIAHERWVEEREQGWSDLFRRTADRFVVGTDEDPLEALMKFFRTRMRLVQR